MAQNGIQRCFSALPILLEDQTVQRILFSVVFPNRTASIRMENLKQKNVPKCRCVNAVKLNKRWLTARGGPTQLAMHCGRGTAMNILIYDNSAGGRQREQ